MALFVGLGCTVSFGAGRLSAPDSSPAPHALANRRASATRSGVDGAAVVDGLRSLTVRVDRLERSFAIANDRFRGAVDATVQRQPAASAQPAVATQLVEELSRAIRSLRSIDPQGHFGPVGSVPPPNGAAVEVDANQFGESMSRSPLMMAGVGELLGRYGRPVRGDLCQDGGYVLRFEGPSHTVSATVRDGRVIDLDAFLRDG